MAAAGGPPRIPPLRASNPAKSHDPVSGTPRAKPGDMPSPEHEALVLLFRNRPTLAAELLERTFGIHMPRFTEARVTSADRTETVPATFRADLVVVLADGERARAAVVLEVQMGRDDDKRFTWPLYVASVREELKCPTYLLVVAATEKAQRWAEAPIELGHPGCMLKPAVIGPSEVPLVTDDTLAEKQPELAVLSVLAHGERDDDLAFQIARTALHGALRLDETKANDYISFILGALGEATRVRLEVEMKLHNWPEPTDLEKRILARGEIAARSHDVLAVLEARGIDVPEPVRERVLGCTDPEVLREWHLRAVHAEDAEDIFDSD